MCGLCVLCVSCKCCVCRPIVQAVTLWNMDPVKWMFSGQEQIDKDIEVIVAFRKATNEFASFARSATTLVMAVNKTKKNGQAVSAGAEDLHADLAKIHQSLQESFGFAEIQSVGHPMSGHVAGVLWCTGITVLLPGRTPVQKCPQLWDA